MGKKYIVEIGRLERLYKAFIGAYGKPEITWLSPEVDLTPYTELDTEQVRKEAYEQRLNDANYAIADDSYKKGLSDAWECTRKIAGIHSEERRKIFGQNLLQIIFGFYSASEAIEKIRQYEQRQEEQITKEDVVRIKSTPEVEILVTYADEEYVSGIALTEVDGNCEIGDQYTNIRISNVEKTGKHYDIVSVLQKMKES